MADDHRYEWLDDDAVERLLTPAQSPSADPEAEAERRLAALLRSLTPAPQALPGEEAALAAFRAARAERTSDAHAFAAASASEGAATAAHGLIPGAVPSVTDTTGPAQISDDASAAAASTPTTRVTDPDPVVRIGVVDRARGLFGRRWRPVKVAVAMAVAGCAIGGVAVAAGTGVLSAPFGRTASEPEAGASVSALDDTGLATPLPPSGTPGASPSPGKDGNSRPSGSPYTPAPKGGGATTGHGGKEDRPGDAPSATPRRDDGGGGDHGDDGNTAEHGATWAARICRDLLAAQQRPGQGVDEHDLRDLERVVGAAGADALRAYCERHASDDGSRSAPGKGGDDGKAKGGDDGDGGHRGRPTGLLPSVLGGPGLQLPKVLPVPLTPLV
ncbi:hypothetical protein AB0H17_17470 [Streptomyces olivoreticuli]